jgi:xanthine phosphoribosyltransferase
MGTSKDYTASRLLTLSWEQLHQDSLALAAKLALLGRPFKGIVAITRGGLAPAAVLARQLNLRKIDTLSIASYDDKIQGRPQVLKAPRHKGKGWLVIDDLADSGATLKTARNILPNATFATVYAKPEGQSEVDVFAEAIDQDVWIVFPWDAETDGADG